MIIDIDPQGNAGSGLGLDVMTLKPNVYDLLIDDKIQEQAIKKTDLENLDIIPSNIDLAGLEVDLRADEDKDYYLKNRIAPFNDSYDFILIDCPPSLGC